MTNKKLRNNSTISLTAIVLISLLAIGLFHEWLSCVVSVLLLIWLCRKLGRDKNFSFNLSFTFLALALIVVFYGLSIFWAVDKGMAFVGFLKFLPIPLFAICLYADKEAENLIKKTLPFVMTVTLIITSVLMQFSPFKSYFSVAGRLSGTFQYPNTFALVLLAAELLCFELVANKYVKAALIAVLAFGILYTGSRTVLVLSVLSNLVLIFLRVRVSKKTALISFLAFAVIAGIAVGLAFGGVSPFNRILKINFGASTFLGRLLYFKDALPVILKHPFGLGYLGFFYTQTTFQTGIYSVKYIHNDILQFCLDIGWLPAIGFVVAVLKSVFGKGMSITNRVILSVMFLHCLFDFDLQFVAVFMLFVVFLKGDGGKVITIKQKDFCFYSGAAVLCAVSLYFSVALGLYSFGQTEASNRMYSLNTDNSIKMLISMKRADGFEDVADSIIKRNPYVYVAYAEKARAAYKEGNFGKLIKYKNLVFEYAPLVYDEYEEYLYMLINGVTLYDEAGDSKSAEICKKQILSTKEKFNDSILKISELGMKIKDKPKTEFPKELEDYIEKLKNGEVG